MKKSILIINIILLLISILWTLSYGFFDPIVILPTILLILSVCLLFSKKSNSFIIVAAGSSIVFTLLGFPIVDLFLNIFTNYEAPFGLAFILLITTWVFNGIACLIMLIGALRKA